MVSWRREVDAPLTSCHAPACQNRRLGEGANKTAIWGSALLVSTGRCRFDQDQRLVILLDGPVTWANVGT